MRRNTTNLDPKTFLTHWQDRFNIGSLVEGCSEVAPAEIPQPSRSLLVHHRHMSRVLAEHYSSSMELHVMRAHREGDIYLRQIWLTQQGQREPVEYAMIEVDLDLLPSAVADEIVTGTVPVGEILIRHNVPRRIEPRSFLRFDPGASCLRMFGEPDAQLFGRLAVIYCNDVQAIRMLEIVTAVSTGSGT